MKYQGRENVMGHLGPYFGGLGHGSNYGVTFDARSQAERAAARAPEVTPSSEEPNQLEKVASGVAYLASKQEDLG